MKQTLLTALKFLVFLGLGILLIWLSVKDLTEEAKSQIKNSFREANYWWVILSMLMGVFAHISRAIRWRMLLAPLGFFPKLSNTFYAVMIGYFGNLALPRLGEVLRCGIFKRYEKIPLTQSFGTVITERLIDTLILLLIFIFCVWREYERMQAFLAEKLGTIGAKFHENKLFVYLIAGIFLIVIILFFIFRKKIVQHPFSQKIKALLQSFWKGMKSAANVKNIPLFIFHSLFIWMMYLLSIFLCVFAFDGTQSLSITDCIVLMAFGSLGVIATPGGIGAYQIIVSQIMLLWGYSIAIGVAFGWVVWLAQTVVVLIGGLLSFGLLAIGNQEKSQTTNLK